MKNNKVYITAFLLLSLFLLHSQNIIIYNEETLVAFSFFAFILFIFRFYGTTIKNFLNERDYSIESELQFLGKKRLESLDHLYIDHSKVVNQGVDYINKFATREVGIIKENGKTLFQTSFLDYINQKLKTFFLFTYGIQQKVQSFLALDWLSFTHTTLKKSN